MRDDDRTQVDALARVLNPQSIAFVGVHDASPFADLVRPTLESSAELHFVYPKAPTVFGRPTVGSLSDVGRPIDAVMVLTSANVTVQIAEEAARLDVGGIVSIAGGFAETGAQGGELQRRLQTAATGAGMAVIGPNGLGYVNVPRQVSLTIAGTHQRRSGGISVVSQSGAMLSGIAMAAWQHRGVGLNIIISAGNEAVTDLADYVSFLAEDPDTTAIGLVVEQVRRPEAFFAAVERAHAARKPVVALKLARSERSRTMAASHTAALAGDAWVYDVAFRQAGIGLAYDPEELIDRLQLFDQLPPHRWTPVTGLATVTMTGGYASLSTDIADAEGVTMPSMDRLLPWVKEHVPGGLVANPLDATGLGVPLWQEITEMYASAEEADALLFIHPLADEDDSPTMRDVVEKFAKATANVDKAAVVANLSGTPAPWVDQYLGDGIALGRGLRPTLRGLAAMAAFTRHRDRVRDSRAAVVPIPRPDVPLVPVPEGSMLPFAATMELVKSVGVPVAPYHLVPEHVDAAGVTAPFAGPYVVKLADVGHRTEHGAVRLGVRPEGLGQAIDELRSVASADQLSSLVAIQPMVQSRGEAFVGVQGSSELGPLVAFGLGGILVEALGRVGGRMAPLSHDEARELLEEFADLKILHGFRGAAPWDLDRLAEILVSAGRLAVGGRAWISSLDINPLINSTRGFVAVDALCIVADEPSAQRPDTEPH
jgi:acyl-CoA synthetase (NDP forming)